MTLKLKRTPGLYLVGFMCSGKTTIGQALAEELGWCFADLDQDIEAQEKQTIWDIFEERGEPAFRAIESNLLERRVAEIEAGNPCVLAVGGGAFCQERNWDIVENNGVTIWLQCPLEVIEQRLSGSPNPRPLAVDRPRMHRLYQERLAFYQRADFVVDSSLNEPSGVVQQILNLPIF